MPHSPAEKKKALLRVRRIRGQAEALERALAEGAECGTVLQQLAAIRGAINGLMSEVLESHIREEFGPPSDADPRHAQRVRDMTELVRTYLK
ncbi:metal/formaldehyde-sensitive transcriptional repressor [Myxococcaceae bacterium GXIMD 01537]